MRTVVAATFIFALAAAQGFMGVGQDTTARAQGAAAAPAGDPEAGRAHFTIGNTSCRNCHGTDGEGGWGPPLAGRGLTYERFRDYVRAPFGRMPAYVESELTDQEIADMVAYFDGLPPVTQVGAWRTELPENAPRGQQLAIGVIGCGQCHGETMETPRHGAAEVTGDWEWFAHMVYDHTTAQREQWALLDESLDPVTPGPAGPPGRNRIRMGNYDRQRLPESTLREIYDWMEDIGLHLAALRGRVTAGDAGPNGTSYTIEVVNAAVRDRGVGVEGVTVELELPAGTKVVSATGQRDGNVWRLPDMPAASRESFTVTLSPAPMTFQGTIRWAEPAVTADPEVNFAFGGGRGRGGA